MIKKIFFCLGISLLSFNVFSQENTSSAYSYYGIGEVRFKGTEAAKAMGGLAITGDSIAINLNNPASYSSLKLTTFSVGGSTNFTTLNAMEKQEKAKSTAFNYIAVGVPMGKFGAVVGLAPYSAIGYKIENSSTDGDLQRVKRFNGSGNINRFFTGFSYQINDEFSVGAGFRYENTGLEINGMNIDDYGMNFGFGLPVGLSKIDIGFEFGQRGTTLKGLVFENYFNINIGLSLSDKWFKKTLID